MVPPLFPSTILLGHARPTAARNHPRAPENTSTRRLVELLRPPRPSKVTYQPTLTLSTPSNAPSSPRPLTPEEVSSDPNKSRVPLQRTRCTRRTGAGSGGGRGRGRRKDSRRRAPTNHAAAVTSRVAPCGVALRAATRSCSAPRHLPLRAARRPRARRPSWASGGRRCGTSSSDSPAAKSYANNLETPFHDHTPTGRACGGMQRGGGRNTPKCPH